MGAEDYQTGGVHWVKVQLVMKACSVSRLKAVSALKVGGRVDHDMTAQLPQDCANQTTT